MTARPLERPPLITRLIGLKPGAIGRFMARQDAGFWAIMVYLFFEYIRPQQLIPAIAVVPWAQIVLIFAILAWLGTGSGFKSKSPVNTAILVYFLIVVVSSVQAYDFSESVRLFPIIRDWVIIYFLIINLVRGPERFAVFLISWLVYNLYMSQGAVKQWAFRGFSFAAWGVLGAPGWFRNSGEFGVEMCVFLPISWHFYQAAKPYLSAWMKPIVLFMPFSALIGAMVSSSRGAQIAIGALLLWVILRSKRRIRGLIGIAIIGGFAFLLLPEEQKLRFTEMGADSTSTRRLTYWTNGVDMLKEHPALGVGYGNWLRYYSDNYVDVSTQVNTSFGYAQLPHNIFVECFAELGVIGLLGLIALIVSNFVVNYRTRKLARAGPVPAQDFYVQMAYGFDGALIGWMVSGFFVTVLYYPFLWINLAFVVALNNALRSEVKKAARLANAGATLPPGPQAQPALVQGRPSSGWLPRRRR